MNLPDVWFQIRGIPSTYRNKDVVFYVGSLVGVLKRWMKKTLTNMIL
jgi:hypothetical protein